MLHPSLRVDQLVAADEQHELLVLETRSEEGSSGSTMPFQVQEDEGFLDTENICLSWRVLPAGN